MQSPDAIDYDQHWNPRLSIENAIGEPKNVVTFGASWDRSGRCTMCESRRVYGQFFEFMELNQFPFDEQARGRFWSVRAGLRYRALAIEVEDGPLWFWIGSHADYDKIVG